LDDVIEIRGLFALAHLRDDGKRVWSWLPPEGRAPVGRPRQPHWPPLPETVQLIASYKGVEYEILIADTADHAAQMTGFQDTAPTSKGWRIHVHQVYEAGYEGGQNHHSLTGYQSLEAAVLGAIQSLYSLGGLPHVSVV
jgi:hypothetical protein